MQHFQQPPPSLGGRWLTAPLVVQDAVRTRFLGIRFWEKKLRKYMQVGGQATACDRHCPSRDTAVLTAVWLGGAPVATGQERAAAHGGEHRQHPGTTQAHRLAC